MLDNLQVFEKSTYDFDLNNEDQRQSEVFGSVMKRQSEVDLDDSYVVKLATETIPRTYSEFVQVDLNQGYEDA